MGVEQGTAGFRDHELGVVERGASTLDQAEIERVFPNREPRTARTPGCGRVVVAAWLGFEPHEEIQDQRDWGFQHIQAITPATRDAQDAVSRLNSVEALVTYRAWIDPGRQPSAAAGQTRIAHIIAVLEMSQRASLRA